MSELKEFLSVFVFVAPFFISFASYRIYVSGEHGNVYFDYGKALVNALVLSKVILLGELARLGKKSENKKLSISTCHKAALFTLFYLAFQAAEGVAHELLHGQKLIGAIDAEAAAGRGEFLFQGLIAFFAFIPFFALREARRVIGNEQFHQLFFGGGPAANSGCSTANPQLGPSPGKVPVPGH